MTFYTVGVYHTTSQEFFQKLVKNKIDTFCDIRQRRAVRGAMYAFANSNRLQKKLSELNIDYLHIDGLAPTTAMRELQYKSDEKKGMGKRDREELSPDFSQAYRKEILSRFDLQGLINQLEAMDAKRVVLFCVEEKAVACHRSIVANELQKRFGFQVSHL
jgi:uncharacterized protein (DUF488 family)